MNKEKLIGLKKIVMNEIGQTLENTTKHEIDFSKQMVISEVLGGLTASLDIIIDDYIQSEQEEITKLHTLIEQQGKELSRRDELIRELDEKCDYWVLEAKKYCAELGEQKIKFKQLECEMCRLEDTEECKQC